MTIIMTFKSLIAYGITTLMIGVIIGVVTMYKLKSKIVEVKE